MTTALCHCTDCQKWSGSAYTSNVVVARKDFKVSKGSPKHYNVKGDSGKMNDHWFCGGMSYLSSFPYLYSVAMDENGGERALIKVMYRLRKQSVYGTGSHAGGGVY